MLVPNHTPWVKCTILIPKSRHCYGIRCEWSRWVEFVSSFFLFSWSGVTPLLSCRPRHMPSLPLWKSDPGRIPAKQRRFSLSLSKRLCKHQPNIHWRLLCCVLIFANICEHRTYMCKTFVYSLWFHLDFFNLELLNFKCMLC